MADDATTSSWAGNDGEPNESSSLPPLPSDIVFGEGGGTDKGGGEKPGDFIGPYRLMQEIGRGGFGVVWLAERRQPFVQRVALKIIKPGMDSREVIARFEQERQALAVMDHPNVAKVIDGGITPPEMGSRPYFVMEHVKGEAITVFCDRNRLTIRARLELFTQVCEAVQHAHMKGIIHRDLKPSNILVAFGDRASDPGSAGSMRGGGRAGSGGGAGSTDPSEPGSVARGSDGSLVKVIDFGVAKAITHTLTDKTIFTEQGRMIGTPEYMSPEQAEMGGTDIDTRTDVYSLGVVLYELLTGVLPFDGEALRSVAHREMLRIIREVEPPTPSKRLTAIGDEAGAEIARKRQGERDSLAKELRRELEWVPLKAMRKDRRERYRTPADLADDVRRFLRGEALEAGPEGVGYRVRTFVRRNRPRISTVVLIAGMFSGSIVSRTIATQREREARNRTAAISSFAISSNYARGAAYDENWREALSVLEGSLRMTELYPHLKSKHLELAAIQSGRARTLFALERHTEAAEALDSAEALIKMAVPAYPGDPYPDVIKGECRCVRALILEREGDREAAESLLKGTVDQDSRVSFAPGQYADFLIRGQRKVEAEAVLTTAWQRLAEHSAPARFAKARAAFTLARLCEARGALAAAANWRSEAERVTSASGPSISAENEP